MSRIKELRKAFGYTQDKLSKRIGVSRSTIAMYETGECEPGMETLRALANIFNTSTDYILGLSDTNVKKPPTPEGMDGLTEKQKQLLEVMRQLTPERQDELLRFAAFQAASEQKPE